MSPRDDAPRDLLFGLLALQNGMVTRDQLVAAFGAWTSAPARSLADILVDQAALNPAVSDQGGGFPPRRQGDVAGGHLVAVGLTPRRTGVIYGP
jgi:hypothetical protein